tara:strand:- start:64 stop:720 length:657 start_codon:yes stop_codon:yes gene_type:complete
MNHCAVIDYTINNYSDYCSNFSFDLQKKRNVIHQPGFHNCFLYKRKKIVLMHVDKCASSSFKFALKNANICDLSNRVKNIDKLKKYFLNNDYKFYAIIRDPKSRYVSGLQEFVKRYNPPKEYVEESLKNNKFIFDEHTAPQHCFLFLCNGKCNYLKLDNQISNKISNLFERQLKVEKRNSSILVIKNECEKLFNQYCLNNKNFYTLYEEDFRLYESAS